MKPEIGRIIRYQIAGYISPTSENQERAAIITKVWSDTCCNLYVFFDGDVGPNGETLLPHTVTSVCEGAAQGTWHWPVRS